MPLPPEVAEHGEVPDHPAEAGAVLADGAGLLLALDVDQPDDRAVHLGDELDAGAVVMLLLALDGVEVRRVEEGEDSALEPRSLVGVGIRAETTSSASISADA